MYPIPPPISVPDPLAIPLPRIAEFQVQFPKLELPQYRPTVFSEPPIPRAEPQPESVVPAEQSRNPATVPPAPPPLPRRIPTNSPHITTPEAKIPDKSQPTPSDESVTINVPGTKLKVPVPRADIVSAAAITSAVSVSATLTATAIFKRLVQLMKPIISALVKRIQGLLGRRPTSFGRQRLLARRQR